MSTVGASQSRIDLAKLDNFLVSTIESMGHGNVTNQMLQGLPFIRKMMEAGNVERRTSPGSSVLCDLEYDENDTIRWVNKGSTLLANDKQILTQAQYFWALVAGTLTFNTIEDKMNVGTEARIDLVTKKLDNFRLAYRRVLETSLLASAATAVAAGNDHIWTLDEVIDSSNPARANLGGIDRSTYSWWQAKEYAGGSMAVQGLEDMRKALTDIQDTDLDPVTMIWTTSTLINAYRARMNAYVRLAPNDARDLEDGAIMFSGVPMYWSTQVQSGQMLMMNTKYLKLYIQSGMEFQSDPLQMVPRTFVATKNIYTNMQLVCSKPRAQAKITGMTA